MKKGAALALACVAAVAAAAVLLLLLPQGGGIGGNNGAGNSGGDSGNSALSRAGAPATATTATATLPALPDDSGDAPEIADRGLKAELVATGMTLPTSMAFVDGGMLVLEKNTGRVILLSGGDGGSAAVQREVLRVNVASGAEQGLLGAAAARSADGRTYVFLYFTEADSSGRPVGNRVYRYDWNVGSLALSGQKLVLDLPALPGPIHNGGKLAVSGDQLFAVIGDVNRHGGGPLTNEPKGEVDDTSVILRTNLDGEPPADNPFAGYGKRPLTLYYAYGIRNSFGLDVDPVTGTLWATENGPDAYDEINVVRPGLNSGWHLLTGPMSRAPGITEGSLMYLQGAHYRDPVFSWKQSVGVTDIEFMTSDRLGDRYTNNIFVGDYNAGALYYFTLNEDRDGLELSYLPELGDLVADDHGEAQKVRIALFDEGITDLETGPDGYLYVLTFGGKLYRIVPS